MHGRAVHEGSHHDSWHPGGPQSLLTSSPSFVSWGFYHSSVSFSLNSLLSPLVTEQICPRHSFCAGWLRRWCTGKESSCQCRRHKRCGFDPWIEKVPWSRKWQPAPVLLPEKSHGQRSLGGTAHGVAELTE